MIIPMTVCTKHLVMWFLKAYKYGPVFVVAKALSSSKHVTWAHGRKAVVFGANKNRDRQSMTTFSCIVVPCLTKLGMK